MVKQTLHGYKMGVHNAYGLPRCSPTNCSVGSRALVNVSSNVFLTISWCYTHGRGGYGEKLDYIPLNVPLYPRARGLWLMQRMFLLKIRCYTHGRGGYGSRSIQKIMISCTHEHESYGSAFQTARTIAVLYPLARGLW
jgi:hypothetical protein